RAGRPRPARGAGRARPRPRWAAHARGRGRAPRAAPRDREPEALGRRAARAGKPPERLRAVRARARERLAARRARARLCDRAQGGRRRGADGREHARPRRRGRDAPRARLVPCASRVRAAARGRRVTPSGTWAVVLNWNGGEQNLACVRSLLAQELAPERVVFVDNASSDGSRERVAREFPALVHLANAENVGYGCGTNRGIEHALAHGAERELLLNHDVMIPTGTLRGLGQEVAERGRLARLLR